MMISRNFELCRFYGLCKSHKYLDFMIYVNHENNKIKNLRFVANFLSI